MKNTLSFAAMLLLATFLLSAQVPDDMKNKFSLQHPDAIGIIWSTVDNGLYKVQYNERNLKHVVVYDKEMDVVWRRNEIISSQVPAAIREYIKTNYPDEKEFEMLVVDEDGKTLYYTSSGKDKKTVYLDKEGRVVRTVYESKDYPKGIEAYYSQKYPEEKFTVYSKDEDGNSDKNGNYLREDRYYDYDYED